MTTPLVAPLANRIKFTKLKIPVTWAGANPLRRCLCLGTEDGLMFDEIPVGLRQAPIQLSDAINGVAFLENSYALGSPSELAIVYFDAASLEERSQAIIPDGVHGVIATTDGHFIAPAGPAGFISVRPTPGDDTVVKLMTIPGEDFYFYEAAHAPGVVAFAARSRGVVVTASPLEQNRHVQAINLQGADVVDLCAVDPLAVPNAFAALAIDGTVTMFADVPDRSPPRSFTFADIAGTAYRVLSARGHLIVLTRDAIHFLVNFASRFLGGDRFSDGRTQVLTMPLEAVDLGLSYDGTLLIVLADALGMLDLADLTLSGNGAMSDAEVCVTDQSSPWQQLSELHELALPQEAA